ncbi:hypothetical protein RIF29_19145 [Crotalaria pallida]|uniref:Integrase catalytic domain-containing protein n=1 Tax=Crotalaria pallida TaxID=3830 RepID=A0AAN9IB59_CROPI
MVARNNRVLERISNVLENLSRVNANQANALKNLVQASADQANQHQQHVEAHWIAEFKKMDPSRFEGGFDPSGAQRWLQIKRDVATYVAMCLTCQKAKIKHKKLGGVLHPLEVPVWKWDNIAMDFVSDLPRTITGYDAVWVIVDRLTKSAHFIPINMRYSMEKLAQLYIKEVIRLHGVPSNIISDRDPRFLSRFRQSLQQALGTELKLSSAYHPQTDGQTERTIQSWQDLLRTCTLEQQRSWEQLLPLVEFTYNNSYHSSIGMAPYEALYGRRCWTPLCWFQVRESQLIGLDVVQETTKRVKMIQEKTKTAQDRVMKPKKLTPRFIGPYQILQRVGSMAYSSGRGKGTILQIPSGFSYLPRFFTFFSHFELNLTPSSASPLLLQLQTSSRATSNHTSSINHQTSNTTSTTLRTSLLLLLHSLRTSLTFLQLRTLLQLIQLTTSTTDGLSLTRGVPPSPYVSIFERF